MKRLLWPSSWVKTRKRSSSTFMNRTFEKKNIHAHTVEHELSFSGTNIIHKATVFSKVHEQKCTKKLPWSHWRINTVAMFREVRGENISHETECRDHIHKQQIYRSLINGQDVRLQIGLIWLRIGTISGLLWTRWSSLGFHKMCRTVWFSEWQKDSQEGLGSMYLVSLAC
jgi:hypothetical protein